MTNTTGTTVNTTNTTTYSKAVDRLTISSLIKLTQAPEFRCEFKPLMKAKDPVSYMEVVIERLSLLIEEGKLDRKAFEINPTLNKEINVVDDLIAASLTGMVKQPYTKEEMDEKSLIANIETFISMGKVAQRFMELYPVVTGESSFGGHWFQLKKYAQARAFNGQANTLLTQKADNIGILKEFLEANESLNTLKKFISQRGVQVRYMDGVTTIPVYNGLRVVVTPSKNKRINALAIGRASSVQPSYTLTPKTLSGEELNAISRVLLVTKTGQLARYNKKGFIGGRGTDLRSLCIDLSYTEVLSLMSLVGAEMSSLLADSRNFVVIEYITYDYEDKKTGETKTVEKYQVSQNAYSNKAIYDVNAQHSFWGISNPDTLGKGIIRAYSGVPGFGETTPEGTYMSFEKKANKTVNRFIKLNKEGDTYVIPQLAVVVGDTGPELTAALSTGTLHVPTDMLKHLGQCRVVSDANNGGIKTTFGSVALMGASLDLAGVAVGAFSSLKANRFGLNILLGREGDDNTPIETSKIFLENVDGGVEADVIIIENVEVTITNNYTINEYRMVNRDDLALSAVQANEKLADRVAAKASEINEDKIFVDFIKSTRDEEYAGNLMECLISLVKQGVIKRKGTTVSITSSEYDVMSYCMGREKAMEFQDNLLGDKLNVSGGDVEYKFKLAYEHNTNIRKGGIKFMSVVEFYTQYKEVCIANGVSFKTPVGSFVSRNFLVDLCTTIFDDKGGDYAYLCIGEGVNSVFIPLGDYFTGSFAETSNVFNDKVVVTGFLAKLLKYVPYGAAMIGTPAWSDWVFNVFSNNVKNELTLDLFGKQLGRLDAKGFYGVLQVAWWSKTVENVVCTGAKDASKSKDCLVAKHPLLMEEALAGAKVSSKFPGHLTQGISDYDLEVLNFVFGRTVFVHEDMLLGLQNDCDGDLIRLTWHDGIEFPLFEGKSLKKECVMSKWHQAYKADEQDFTGIKNVEMFEHSITDIMDGVTNAAYAKSKVALYSANAQRLGQRFHIDSNESLEFYKHVQLIVNSWVQVFAMNSIKQNEGSESTDLMLPEYFLIWNMHEDVATTGVEKFLEYLKDVLKVNMKNYGYKSNKAFVLQVIDLFESIQDKSEGTKMIGKDMKMSDLKDLVLDFEGLDPRVLQDRLVLKMLERLA